jgi:putative DNA primase/helicase
VSEFESDFEDADFPMMEFHPWDAMPPEPEPDEAPSIAAGNAAEIRVIPPPTDPGGVANAYLAYLPYPLRRWRDTWYRWNGAYWASIPDNELKAAINAWLTASACLDRDGRPAPWNPTKKKRDEVLDTLSLHPDVFLSDAVREEIEGIPFRNGVLSVDGDLSPHDSGPMRTWCVDAEYSADAECPEWIGFLGSALQPDQVALAQEWAGYVLSGDTRAHKVFLAHGARRAGKSTYARVLGAMLGDGAAATTPDDMLSPFGLESLSGARLVTMGDVRWSDKASRKMLDKVRAISGGDPQPVNRKFKPALQGVILPGRFMFTSNDLPSFGDDSGATLSRFLLLGFVHDHEGREDHELLSRLLGEIPGIARWALDGYRRLVKNGLHFTDPVRSRADRDDLRLDVEPVRSFCAEMLAYDEHAWISIVDLYDEFRTWRGFSANEDDSTGRVWFGRKVKAALPAIRGERQYVTRKVDGFDPKAGTKRVRERGFAGIRMITEDDKCTTPEVPTRSDRQQTLDESW